MVEFERKNMMEHDGNISILYSDQMNPEIM
jgi:hypothetical protein